MRSFAACRNSCNRLAGFDPGGKGTLSGQKIRTETNQACAPAALQWLTPLLWMSPVTTIEALPFTFPSPLFASEVVPVSRFTTFISAFQHQFSKSTTTMLSQISKSFTTTFWCAG